MRAIHDPVGRKMMSMWDVLGSSRLNKAYGHYIDRYVSHDARSFSGFSDVMMAPNDEVRNIVSKGERDVFHGRKSAFCGDMHIRADGKVAYSLKSVATAARLDGERASPVLRVEIQVYGQDRFDPKGLGIPRRTKGIDVEYIDHVCPLC